MSTESMYNTPRRFYQSEIERTDFWARIYTFFTRKILYKTVFTEADAVTYEHATHEEVIIQGKHPFIFNSIGKDE